MKQRSFASLVSLIALMFVSESKADEIQFVNGLHCLWSPLVTGDVLPDFLTGSKDAYVYRIEKLVNAANKIEGFVYVSSVPGKRLVQPLKSMSSRNLLALQAEPLALVRAPKTLPASLRVKSCRSTELTTKRLFAPVNST